MSSVRIGIDLGGTKIEGIALHGSREVVRLRVDTPRDHYEQTLEAVAGLVASLEQRSQPVPVVGVGIPGAPAPDTGLIKNANSTWLIGRPLHADLEARLGRPVRLANDANCFAVSEAADGAAAGAAVVFGVIIGTGTGAGIVINGQVLSGPNAVAGEWGHNPMPWPEPDEWPGPPCYCGRTGCIETFLSGPALARDFTATAGRNLTPADIVTLAAGHDPQAAAVMTRYEDRLARALASVINVLDPDVVALGGGLSNIDRLYRNVPPLWPAHVFGATRPAAAEADRSSSADAGRGTSDSPSSVRTRLVKAAHGDSSGVRGAAWLWPDSR